MTVFGKESGSLTQGDNITGETVIDTLFVLTHQEIRNTATDIVVTYGILLVKYLPKKRDPNRVRITASGNLITYPGYDTTRKDNLATSKILWNSVLSTSQEKYMCINIKTFHLCVPMDRYEYMRMKLTDFPEHVQQTYNLQAHDKNGYIYLGTRMSIYGLPQAGKLANESLRDKLRPNCYYEVSHNQGIWKHISFPNDFSLVLDDSDIKYVGEDNDRHLIDSLKK